MKSKIKRAECPPRGHDFLNFAFFDLHFDLPRGHLATIFLEKAEPVQYL